MQELWDGFSRMLGLGQESFELSIWQMMLRAVIVYVAALAMVRLGDKRVLGKLTAFDVVVGFVVGSISARAITGNAPFFPALGAVLTLVLLHWLFAELAFHSQRFADMVKGTPRPLIEDGQVLWDNMKKASIGEGDLMSALRRQARITNLNEVEAAYLERTGDISVIPRVEE